MELICLSSDTDNDDDKEDVTTMKILKKHSKNQSDSSRHPSRRWDNSKTIKAPSGSILEVDLTQEVDHQG